MRSKSEVIIANMLFEADIPYEYEKELFLGKMVSLFLTSRLTMPKVEGLFTGNTVA